MALRTREKWPYSRPSSAKAGTPEVKHFEAAQKALSERRLSKVELRRSIPGPPKASANLRRVRVSKQQGRAEIKFLDAEQDSSLEGITNAGMRSKRNRRAADASMKVHAAVTKRRKEKKSADGIARSPRDPSKLFTFESQFRETRATQTPLAAANLPTALGRAAPSSGVRTSRTDNKAQGAIPWKRGAKSAREGGRVLPSGIRATHQTSCRPGTEKVFPATD